MKKIYKKIVQISPTADALCYVLETMEIKGGASAALPTTEMKAAFFIQNTENGGLGWILRNLNQ